MEYISISGGKRLYGEIDVQGSKNAALPILAATLLNKKESVVKNCPDIEDVRCAIEMLKVLGCETEFSGNTVTVDSQNARYAEIPDNLVKKMRSSVMFAGAVLSRFGKCTLKSPGGCDIGARPVDMHINAFKLLGADVIFKDDNCVITLDKFKENHLKLPFPSVGVTENIMLLCAAKDCDIIVENAAREPEISDLAEFLNSMGAKVYGAGTAKLRINGSKALDKTEHTVIPDRIAVCTYLFGALCTRGEAVLNKANSSHILRVCDVIEKMGADINCEKDKITVRCDKRTKSVEITADVYPHFPTDVQPLAAACLCTSKGTGIISDAVFPERFAYANELLKFGADITRGGYGIKIRGVETLKGADAFAKELRGGAALVIAALGAEGKSRIFDISHILRGYENITGDFKALGGNIKIVKESL